MIMLIGCIFSIFPIILLFLSVLSTKLTTVEKSPLHHELPDDDDDDDDDQIVKLLTNIHSIKNHERQRTSVSSMISKSNWIFWFNTCTLILIWQFLVLQRAQFKFSKLYTLSKSKFKICWKPENIESGLRYETKMLPNIAQLHENKA